MTELIKELQEKEKDVNQTEQEIKKRHTQIAAKQLKVDRLNRQLADNKKDSGEGEESQGPLENEKNSIQKNI